MNTKIFFKLSDYDKQYEYSVFWIEKFSTNKISGLNFLSKHSKNKSKKNITFSDKKINFISLLILKFIVNNQTILNFSNFMYKKINKYFYKKIENYNKVFYPQDRYLDWNKVYGKKGFFSNSNINSKI